VSVVSGSTTGFFAALALVVRLAAGLRVAVFLADDVLERLALVRLLDERDVFFRGAMKAFLWGG
jgi:hypothetical protein